MRILNTPDIARTVQAQGLEVWTMTSDAFGELIKAEIEKWWPMIKAMGIKGE